MNFWVPRNLKFAAFSVLRTGVLSTCIAALEVRSSLRARQHLACVGDHHAVISFGCVRTQETWHHLRAPAGTCSRTGCAVYWYIWCPSPCMLLSPALLLAATAGQMPCSSFLHRFHCHYLSSVHFCSLTFSFLKIPVYTLELSQKSYFQPSTTKLYNIGHPTVETGQI